MSKKINFCLFLWPKYTNEDCQPIPWLILLVLLGGICQNHTTYTSGGAKSLFLGLYSILLGSLCPLYKDISHGRHYIGHSLSSNSAFKCPFSSMCFCFYGLSIYQGREILLGGFCQRHVMYARWHTKLPIHYIAVSLIIYVHQILRPSPTRTRYRV